MKTEPEVTQQPPATSNLNAAYKNIDPDDGWAVIVDMGSFDLSLFESQTKSVVEIYYYQARTLTNKDLEIIPVSRIRKLREVFRVEEILVSLSVAVVVLSPIAT